MFLAKCQRILGKHPFFAVLPEQIHFFIREDSTFTSKSNGVVTARHAFTGSENIDVRLKSMSILCYCRKL